jgi:glyoxylase-like metal-dependent hydrolase (beta-lactamase superfamily II)
MTEQASSTAADELWLEQIAVGPMQNFVYVVGSRSTREVALVDPAWDVGGLLDHLEKEGLRCVAALVTHYHPDHVGGSMMGMRIEGLAELLERQPVRVYAHRAEALGIQRVTGIEAGDLVQVDSGDRLQLGGVEIEFLHTPGHTPGSQCFRVRDTLVSGDTLFIEGCGRVDLPGSDPDQMYESLQRLARLPDDTVLLPGHDYGPVPHDTLGHAKRTNPYLRVHDLASWRALMGR